VPCVETPESSVNSVIASTCAHLLPEPGDWG
jgi:hypothetical protein